MRILCMAPALSMLPAPLCFAEDTNAVLKESVYYI